MLRKHCSTLAVRSQVLVSDIFEIGDADRVPPEVEFHVIHPANFVACCDQWRGITSFFFALQFDVSYAAAANLVNGGGGFYIPVYLGEPLTIPVKSFTNQAIPSRETAPCGVRLA